jgi:hypothetical protein
MTEKSPDATNESVNFSKYTHEDYLQDSERLIEDFRAFLKELGLTWDGYTSDSDLSSLLNLQLAESWAIVSNHSEGSGFLPLSVIDTLYPDFDYWGEAVKLRPMDDTSGEFKSDNREFDVKALPDEARDLVIAIMSLRQDRALFESALRKKNSLALEVYVDP